MPIYAYNCRSCLREFSELKPFSEREQASKCPHCGSEQTKYTIVAPFVAAKYVGDTGPTQQAVGPPSVQGQEALSPHAVMNNVTLMNSGGAAIHVGPGQRVQAQNVRLINNKVGIINEGHYDGPDTIIQ